jgi:hypothetical protein
VNQELDTREASHTEKDSPRAPLLSHISVSREPDTLHLDFLPHAHLEPFIRHLQASIRPGAAATLEFTTLSPGVASLSTRFVLSALALLPRRTRQQNTNTHARSKRSARPRQRTPVSLLTSLHRVVELLTANPAAARPPLTVVGVRNVSGEYALALGAAAAEMVDARRVREALVGRLELRGWREERFWLEWEAAVVEAGFLERWIVVVRR